jgi:hypothetical protein
MQGGYKSLPAPRLSPTLRSAVSSSRRTNVAAGADKRPFASDDVESLFRFFTAFMDANQATAYGESELRAFINFVEQFASVPHSALPAELLPKVVDMILRCEQNDTLASRAEHLLCALVERDPMCCEALLCPDILSLVLRCARAIERRPYESSWHYKLFSAVTVALVTDFFGPLLRQCVVDDKPWLGPVVGCVASGLYQFRLSVLPVFLRLLLTFAEVGCDDEALVDVCLGGVAKLLRAELEGGNPSCAVYFAGNLVYELMKSPAFRLASLREHRYEELISRTFFVDSLTGWWTFVLASIAESGNDITEFIHVTPDAIADRIVAVSPEQRQFLLHVLARMYEPPHDILAPAGRPVMKLARWIVTHIGDGFGFAIKKQMMLCLFMIALRSDEILFDAPALWEEVLPLIVGPEADDEITWAVLSVFAAAARRREVATQEDRKALLGHSAVIALLEDAREPTGIEILDAVRMEFVECVGRFMTQDEDGRTDGEAP